MGAYGTTKDEVVRAGDIGMAVGFSPDASMSMTGQKEVYIRNLTSVCMVRDGRGVWQNIHRLRPVLWPAQFHVSLDRVKSCSRRLDTVQTGKQGEMNEEKRWSGPTLGSKFGSMWRYVSGDRFCL